MKKPFKHVFVLSLDIFNEDILFCINGEYADALKYLKSKKVPKEIEEHFKQSEESFKGTNLGFFHSMPAGNNKHLNLLVVQNWTRSPQNFHTLVHEIVHAVHVLLIKNKNMVDELEAVAYSVEYLLSEATRKIDKEFFKKKKRKHK